jgi:hypothetical protein
LRRRSIVDGERLHHLRMPHREEMPNDAESDTMLLKIAAATTPRTILAAPRWF